MKEKRTPVVSIITLAVMLVLAVISLISLPTFFAIRLGGFWAICAVMLFLSEWLGGRTEKKKFSSNIGIFAVDVLIAAAYVVLLLRSFGEDDGADLMIFFLPPLIVSLFANIISTLHKIQGRAPAVSIITLFILICGVIFTSLLHEPLMHYIWGDWAVCAAALFLCECRFGRKNELRSSNRGVFVVDAVIAAVFFVLLLLSLIVRGSYAELSIMLESIAFLPPLIVSLAANIGNIIYKNKRGIAQ